MDHFVIEKTKLLLVEGDDEVNFFYALFKHMGVEEQIHVHNSGGKSNISRDIKKLAVSPNYDALTHVGIIQDADQSAFDAFRSVQNALRNRNMPFPDSMGGIVNGTPNIGVFIIPTNSEEGMLEDLCLKTRSDHPAMECVEAFMLCLKNNVTDFPKNETKAKCMSFVAACTDAHSLGIAAKRGCWNLDHECLSDLKEFIMGLFCSEI